MVAQSYGKRALLLGDTVGTCGCVFVVQPRKSKDKDTSTNTVERLFWATVLVLGGVFSLFKLNTNRCRALVWCFGMFYMPTSTSAGRCAVCVCFVMLVVCTLLICFVCFLVARQRCPPGASGDRVSGVGRGEAERSKCRTSQYTHWQLCVFLALTCL